MITNYDVFISYRREGGDFVGKAIYDKLTSRGISCFFDVETMRSGKFNEQLYEVIQNCKDVLVVLSPGALDRCVNEEDWVRKEIRHAMEYNKNIIPIMLRNFNWPQNLPEDIKELPDYEGVVASSEYFDASVEKICKLLNSAIPEEKSHFDHTKFVKFANDTIYIKAQEAKKKEDYETALQLFTDAFSAGNTLAGVKLAILYHNGLGTEKDVFKAYQLFAIAEKEGDPLAKGWIAEYYRIGHAVIKDKNRAESIFKACFVDLNEMAASGDGDAQYFLGFNYLYGIAIAKDENKAVAFLKNAYKNGVTSAGATLADCYFRGVGCPIDKKLGKEILEECAKTGSAKSKFLLGKEYYFGKNLEKDCGKALELFRYAAEKGHVLAGDFLADCYYSGNGIDKDYKEATRWYLKAFEGGNNHAASQLGYIYYAGQETDKDINKAIYYWKYAAENNNRFSMYMLSKVYFYDKKYKDNGLGKTYLLKAVDSKYPRAVLLAGEFYLEGTYGFPKDAEKAYNYLCEAEKEGLIPATRLLGEMYYNGIYVEQDKAKGLEKLKYAVAHDDPESHVGLAAAILDKTNITLSDLENAAKEISLGLSELSTTKTVTKMTRIYFRFAEKYYDIAVRCSGKNAEVLFKNAFKICKKLYFLEETRSLPLFARLIFLHKMDPGAETDLNAVLSGLEKAAMDLEEMDVAAKAAALLAEIYFEGCTVKIISDDIFETDDETEDFVLKKDSDKYGKWLEIAIGRGDLSKAFEAAEYMYFYKWNYDKAVKYAKVAHENGYKGGTYILSLCYKDGKGVAKDRKLAKELKNYALK